MLGYRASGAASAKHAGENVAEAATTAAGALSASAAGEIRKIKSAEIKWRTLTAAATWRRSSAETACAKSSATRVGFRRRGIDVVGIEPELVVDLALLGIAEYIVGFREFFELLLSFFVVGIYVRMVFASKLAKSFTDFFLGSGLLHAQDAVIVFLLSCRHRPVYLTL